MKGHRKDSWNDDETIASDYSSWADETDSRSHVIRKVNLLFTDALVYQAYRFSASDQTYNDRIAQRISMMQKRFQVHMRYQVFDTSDPFSIL